MYAVPNNPKADVVYIWQEVTRVLVQKEPALHTANFHYIAQWRCCKSNKWRSKLQGRGVTTGQQTRTSNASPRNKALNCAVSQLRDFWSPFLFMLLFFRGLHHHYYLFSTFSLFPASSFSSLILSMILALLRQR